MHATQRPGVLQAEETSFCLKADADEAFADMQQLGSDYLRVRSDPRLMRQAVSSIDDAPVGQLE